MSDPALIHDQAILEAATRALDNCIEGYQATSILAAVTPLVRAVALEEAAKVAEDEDGEFWYAGEHRNMIMLQQHGFEIAAAIRALKSAAPAPSADSA